MKSTPANTSLSDTDKEAILDRFLEPEPDESLRPILEALDAAVLSAAKALLSGDPAAWKTALRALDEFRMENVPVGDDGDCVRAAFDTASASYARFDEQVRGLQSTRLFARWAIISDGPKKEAPGDEPGAGGETD